MPLICWQVLASKTADLHFIDMGRPAPVNASAAPIDASPESLASRGSSVLMSPGTPLCESLSKSGTGGSLPLALADTPAGGVSASRPAARSLDFEDVLSPSQSAVDASAVEAVARQLDSLRSPSQSVGRPSSVPPRGLSGTAADQVSI